MSAATLPTNLVPLRPTLLQRFTFRTLRATRAWRTTLASATLERKRRKLQLPKCQS